MKFFWNVQISEIAESYIFCVKPHADLDAAIDNWLRPFFVEC